LAAPLRLGSEKASENQQVIVEHRMGDKSLELSLLINIYDKQNTEQLPKM
jgi:hypothetical protein